jgi:hypothetical protein
MGSDVQGAKQQLLDDFSKVIADAEGLLEAGFNDAVLLAGRACRDALARVCRWHAERGDRDVRCPPAPPRNRR